MSDQCDECRKPLRGKGQRTMMRTLCEQCYARSTGLAAGLIAGGTMGDAVSTAGWFSHVRAFFRDRQKEQD